MKLHKDRRGQASIEMLFVIPLLVMLFTFIAEVGYLAYDWSVINYHTGTAAVRSATKGKFSETERERLALNIYNWTVHGKDVLYDTTGTISPAEKAPNTVYIYGSDKDESIQRGQFIFINVDYPWSFKFFLIDALAGWVIDKKDLRLRINAAAPSEVFIE